MKDSSWYTTHCIESLDDFLTYTDGLEGKWVFRGQKPQKGQTFVTSLERAAKSFDTNRTELADLERKLIREFRRRYNIYSTSYVPEKNDVLEWLALMQHYGAPTRLLDWTYSFYVAAYLALARDGDGYKIWALNTEWFNYARVITDRNFWRKNSSWFKKRHDNLHWTKQEDSAEEEPAVKRNLMADYLMNRHPQKLVMAVNPFVLNDRLAAQQGLFLFPGNISEGFDDNLTVRNYREEANAHLVRIIVCPDLKLRKDILYRLHRMNINSATLFPGLQGFAESLCVRLAFPETLGG